MPADRYFGAAPEVLRSIKERLQANALELAQNGIPKKPFYLAGQLGGKPFSLHTEGEHIFLIREDGRREEVELVTPHGPLGEDAALALAQAREDDPLCPDGSPGESPVMDKVPGPASTSLEKGLGDIVETFDQTEGHEEERA